MAEKKGGFGALSVRRLPKPDPTKLDDVQRKQFEYVIATYAETSKVGFELTDFYAVHDAEGAHVYDMHLFCGEDGQVFVAGTTKRVGGFSQGGADCDDDALGDALEKALAKA